MIKSFCKSNKGAVMVMTALMLPVLLAFVGLALDIGNMVVIKTKMQNTADAAVLGGGLLLPDTSQALAQANSLITSNNFNPANASITFNQDVAKNPSNFPEINCSLTTNVQTYFMGMLGFNTVPMTVLAEGILIGSNPGGPFNYAIFSGSNFDLTLNGSNYNVRGSVHTNDDLRINGSNNHITGAAEAARTVNLNGSSNQLGSVSADLSNHVYINGSNNQIGPISGGSQNIGMPDYSQQIASNAGRVYSTSQTFNGDVSISGDIHVQGSVTLNGSNINSTGAILADGNISLNGSGMTINGSNQACLYSKNGNITVNGSNFNSTAASAILYAPNGTVTINGSNMNFQGRIIGWRVNLNGSNMTIIGDNQVKSLPGKNHVKLIR